MSYNKRTIENEAIDFVEEVLGHLGIEYKLDILGVVRSDDPQGLEIRRLEVRGLVLRERMERTDGCDMDDVVECYLFKPGEEQVLALELREGETDPSGLLHGVPKPERQSTALHELTLDACEEVTDGLSRELSMRGIQFESLAQVYQIKEELLAVVRKHKLSVDLEVVLFCMMLHVAVKVKRGKAKRP